MYRNRINSYDKKPAIITNPFASDLRSTVEYKHEPACRHVVLLCMKFYKFIECFFFSLLSLI
jgi:hypothetical protein